MSEPPIPPVVNVNPENFDLVVNEDSATLTYTPEAEPSVTVISITPAGELVRHVIAGGQALGFSLDEDGKIVDAPIFP